MLRRGAGAGLALIALGVAVRSDEPCRSADRRHRPATSAAARPPRRLPRPPIRRLPRRSRRRSPPRRRLAPPVDPLVAEVRRQLAEPPKGNVDRTDRAALAAFYAERNELADLGHNGRADGQGAPCHGGDRQGRRLGACRQRLRAAATGARRGRACRARRRRDQARPCRPQVCPPCQRRPHRPGAAQQASRPEAYPARAQGGARGDGRDAIRPAPTCATSIPSTCSSSACARRCSRRAAASQPGLPSRRGRKRRPGFPDGPTLKLGSVHPDVAIVRQRLGLPLPRGAENHLRSGGPGRAEGVPGPEQYSDHGHADAAHARRPSTAERDSSPRRRSLRLQARTCSG